MRRSTPVLAALLLTCLGGCSTLDRPADPAASPAARQRWGEPAAWQADPHRASELVLAALNFIDVPYRRGGDADDGFDCSGFTRHIYERAVGVVLPRTADEQARAPGFVAVRRHELQPGDLVFFNTLGRAFSHVGIHLGDGRFIHSPRAGAQVRVEDMGASYWARRFTGARRALAVVAGDVRSP